MAEYKDTLNLPETAFPMKANLVQREPEMLAFWQSNQINTKEVEPSKRRFILHDGPPYANGHLHCGHALNKVLKDIINKSKNLCGFESSYVPGWDCHGLPIELNVEKKYGKAGARLNAKEFREACRDYAANQISIQKNEFKRLGIFGDWENPYTTMDYSYEANAIRALGLVIKNGHLHQGFKPVHWCIECGSALAEAEVDFEDKVSAAIDVAFFAVSPENFLSSFDRRLPIKPLIVPIWTTTPWSLPANEAVALHPEFSYSLVEAGERYLLIASKLLDSVLSRYQIADYKVLGEVEGNLFEGCLVKHPFDLRNVPIILSNHVTSDAGTGCVHIAPAHGPDDYQLGLANKLPLKNPVKTNGCYDESLPLLGGLFILKASDQIIDLLKEGGTLLHKAEILHSYPHCWRHKTPMIFLATPQWFIAMDKNGLREQILQAIDQITWMPHWGKLRMINMVKDRPDWCISRQRTWGTPLALFVHKKTREMHPNSVEFIEKIAKEVEKKGALAWFELDVDEFLGTDAEEYEQITDTVDVWFDSGVSHYCVLSQNKALGVPANLYLEGSDQYRGWFNSSLTTAIAMYNHAPYEMVLSHGYTVDSEGKKLSKSKKNYVDLEKLINQYGADILRLWVASTDYRSDVSISDEIIKRTAEAYRRIRNTARFLLANLFDFDPAVHSVKASELIQLDAWAIKRAQKLQEEIQEAYHEYNFHIIYQKIHNFCTVDMGSFYLDVIKDRQYTTAKRSLSRRSCQTAIFHIVHALTRWLAPILSFTADEIWRCIPGYTGDSIFSKQWYDEWLTIKEISMEHWETVQLVRNEVNKALEEQRKNGVIGSALAAEVNLYANENVFSLLAPLGKELRFLFITSEAKINALKDCPKDVLRNEELGVSIVVTPSQHEKCVRCWHRREDVGEDSTYPELCLRCVGNIVGQDETRYFV